MIIPKEKKVPNPPIFMGFLIEALLKMVDVMVMIGLEKIIGVLGVGILAGWIPKC